MISRELLLAILAMDSYNRDYAAALAVLITVTVHLTRARSSEIHCMTIGTEAAAAKPRRRWQRPLAWSVANARGVCMPELVA
jgi:hypothetical protein